MKVSRAEIGNYSDISVAVFNVKEWDAGVPSPPQEEHLPLYLPMLYSLIETFLLNYTRNINLNMCLWNECNSSSPVALITNAYPLTRKSELLALRASMPVTQAWRRITPGATFSLFWYSSCRLAACCLPLLHTGNLTRHSLHTKQLPCCKLNRGTKHSASLQACSLRMSKLKL